MSLSDTYTIHHNLQRLNIFCDKMRCKTEFLCSNLLIFLAFSNYVVALRTYTKNDMLQFRLVQNYLIVHAITIRIQLCNREEVREMFYHAYDSYLKYAYPYDELRPLSCDGVDTYGRYVSGSNVNEINYFFFSYSLTLIDALDMLAIIGNKTEFQRVVDILTTKESFDANINVSVFETNIRIIGGLLSAHLLSHR